jgi:hypothetical protein
MGFFLARSFCMLTMLEDADLLARSGRSSCEAG